MNLKRIGLKQLLLLIISFLALSGAVIFYIDSQRFLENRSATMDERGLLEPTVTTDSQEINNNAGAEIQIDSNDQDKLEMSVNLNRQAMDSCKGNTCIAVFEVKSGNDFTEVSGSEFNLNTEGQNRITVPATLFPLGTTIRVKVSVLNELAVIIGQFHSQELTVN